MVWGPNLRTQTVNRLRLIAILNSVLKHFSCRFWSRHTFSAFRCWFTVLFSLLSRNCSRSHRALQPEALHIADLRANNSRKPLQTHPTPRGVIVAGQDELCCCHALKKALRIVFLVWEEQHQRKQAAEAIFCWWLSGPAQRLFGLSRNGGRPGAVGESR